jgi:hypothetical protein
MRKRTWKSFHWWVAHAHLAPRAPLVCARSLLLDRPQSCLDLRAQRRYLPVLSTVHLVPYWRVHAPRRAVCCPIKHA